MSEKISICNQHADGYEVPIIATWAFGSNVTDWCPYCGLKNIQSVLNFDITPELQFRHDFYLNLSKEYLYAESVAHCDSLTWNGEQISPDELPSEEKARIKKIRDEWKYGIKPE